MLEVYFESYGCTANQNSTEIMKGIVKQAGLNITQNPDFADIIIINSCIVKSSSQEKIRRKVFDFLEKGKKVILAGCMPRLNQKKLYKENLYLLDTSHVKNLLNLLKDMQENNYSRKKYLEHRNEIKLNLPKIPQERFIGITQISEGCLGECPYCIVRLAKGKLFSFPIEKIIESVKKDIESGCKEIWLTSQDNAAYGNDEGKYLLHELLKKILSLPGKFFVRLGMMNPNNLSKILPEIIELYKHPKMFKFLHMPIQSGSNKILKAMKRKYTSKEVITIINAFKKQIPPITIATDIIVGFPGETDKDFNETVELIKKIQPEILNRSNFSSHKGTSAEKLKQIPSEVMRKRASELMNLHLRICNELQKPWLGKEINVLIDKKGFENTWLGRTDAYKLAAVISKEKILGRIVKAKVKKILPHYLICELL